MTLTDLSESVLAVSRRLDPECLHVQGDMRTLRLGRRFDACCRPGGVALVVRDSTGVTSQPATDCGGSDGPDARGARCLTWAWLGCDSAVVIACGD